jgi:hypothetical protein
MNSNNNPPKKYIVLEFKCRDFETWIEGNDPKYQCCQYCMHLNETAEAIELWRCKMPSREAQRRRYANLDNQQKTLQNITFLSEKGTE